MMRLWILLMLVVLPGAALAMGNLPSSAVTENLAGKPAPEFTLETTANKSETLTQARDGKKTIMIFWATWCPHCREELESLRQTIDTIKQKGIQIILVDVGESKEDAGGYLKRQQIPLDSFVDEDNTVAGQYSIIGIPTLIFIDEKGILRAIDHEFPADYESKFAAK